MTTAAVRRSSRIEKIQQQQATKHVADKETQSGIGRGSLELAPLPPVESIHDSDLPNTDRCEWSFDSSSRVLLAKFKLDEGSGPDGHLHPTDEQFLLRAMQRDDVTVISEGLVNDLDQNIWDLRFVSGLAGDEPYHKVRRFRRHLVEVPQGQDDGPGRGRDDGDRDQREAKQYQVKHKEVDKFLSMKVSDYVDYLEKRATTLDAIVAERTAKGTHPVNPRSPEDDRIGRHFHQEEADHEDNEGSEPSPEDFKFVTHDGKESSVNVVDDVLYLIDYDLPKLLPKLHDDFVKSFRLPDCLPGGTHCMMNSVNSKGRPFMGPNFYVTPPASFTHFHQDGHGTVDSGHVCLSGYNEVIMLRRMPEKHKRRALYILNDRDGKKPSRYDGLYGLPHADHVGEKPSWPSNEAIQKCKDMNYYPSVFILKPGQLVHINKGRLHAFRKMSPAALPLSDCHSSLRSQLIADENLGSSEQTCVSVAWDWMYKGVTSEGINHELVSTLECAGLNRQHDTQSLAIPEASVLHMARQYVSQHEREVDTVQPRSLLPFLSSHSAGGSNAGGASRVGPSTLDVLKGIAPSLEFVVDRHGRACEEAEQNGVQSGQKVSLAQRPNTWENPEVFPLDPYGDGDFFCKKCGAELSNCYMHCDGCETLLSKDYNICIKCHGEGRYLGFDVMNPSQDSRRSCHNHNGGTTLDRTVRCPCKRGKACKSCGYCDNCSCRCHKSFTLHHRFMSTKDEEALRGRVRTAVGGVLTDATLTAISETPMQSGTDQHREKQQGTVVASHREEISAGRCHEEEVPLIAVDSARSRSASLHRTVENVANKRGRGTCSERRGILHRDLPPSKPNQQDASEEPNDVRPVEEHTERPEREEIKQQATVDPSSAITELLAPEVPGYGADDPDTEVLPGDGEALSSEEPVGEFAEPPANYVVGCDSVKSADQSDIGEDRDDQQREDPSVRKQVQQDITIEPNDVGPEPDEQPERQVCGQERNLFRLRSVDACRASGEPPTTDVLVNDADDADTSPSSSEEPDGDVATAPDNSAVGSYCTHFTGPPATHALTVLVGQHGGSRKRKREAGQQVCGSGERCEQAFTSTNGNSAITKEIKAKIKAYIDVEDREIVLSLTENDWNKKFPSATKIDRGARRKYARRVIAARDGSIKKGCWDDKETKTLKSIFDNYQNKRDKSEMYKEMAQALNRTQQSCFDKCKELKQGNVKVKLGKWSREESLALETFIRSKLRLSTSCPMAWIDPTQVKGAFKWKEASGHVAGRNAKQCRERFLVLAEATTEAKKSNHNE